MTYTLMPHVHLLLQCLEIVGWAILVAVPTHLSLAPLLEALKLLVDIHLACLSLLFEGARGRITQAKSKSLGFLSE